MVMHHLPISSCFANLLMHLQGDGHKRMSKATFSVKRQTEMLFYNAWLFIWPESLLMPHMEKHLVPAGLAMGSIWCFHHLRGKTGILLSWRL